jgi:polar amino acid transport system substrate-binding protein
MTAPGGQPVALEAEVIGDFMQAVYRDLAPSGTLRAAISYSNVSVVQKDAAGGEPKGLAIDTIDELARRLGRPRVIVTFDGAAAIVEAVTAGQWDLAFLAFDRARTERLDFTRPYVVLEGSLLVRDGSAHRTALDLDRPGMRIAVAEGSFHDLHLSRTLQHAQLMRSPSFDRAVEHFLADGLDAMAGMRQPLADISAARGGLHLIEGRYAAVEQAIAVPKGRSAGLRYLNAYVNEMRTRSG